MLASPSAAPAAPTPSRPRPYEWAFDVRFADLDPYGHVSVDRYLDFVNSSRWLFAQERLGISAQSLMQKNLGLYTVRSEIDYRKAIVGLQRIVVRSHVAAIDGAKIRVEFEIISSDGAVVFASGNFLCLAIDLAQQRSTPVPDWFLPYVFT